MLERAVDQGRRFGPDSHLEISESVCLGAQAGAGQIRRTKIHAIGVDNDRLGMQPGKFKRDWEIQTGLGNSNGTGPGTGPIIDGRHTSAGYIGGWSFSEYAPPYSFGSSGFPSGRIGYYTTIAGVAFSGFESPEAAPVHLNGRWINDSGYAVNVAGGNGLTLSAGGPTEYNNILLENLRLQKFQATFALTRATGQSRSWIGFVFNSAERGNFNYLGIYHDSVLNNPAGFLVSPSAAPSAVTGDTHPSNVPTCGATDTLWVRVQNDGTTVTVKAINTPTAPSESTWSSTTACYSNSTGFSNIGGMIGFNCTQGRGTSTASPSRAMTPPRAASTSPSTGTISRSIPATTPATRSPTTPPATSPTTASRSTPMTPGTG